MALRHETINGHKSSTKLEKNHRAIFVFYTCAPISLWNILAAIIFQASKPLIINSGTKGRLTVVLLYAASEKWSHQQTKRKRNAQIIGEEPRRYIRNYGNKTLARCVHVWNKKFHCSARVWIGWRCFFLEGCAWKKNSFEVAPAACVCLWTDANASPTPAHPLSKLAP